MSVIDEVKDRVDIVDLVSSYLPLQKAGRNFKALCPFHQEKTPSFIVFPEGGRWHCFGACATGGDIFTFVERMENVDFAQALRILADRAGVALAPRSSEARDRDRRRDRLTQLNAQAAAYFHDHLGGSEEAEAVREHLRGREISPESWQRFQLGYSPRDGASLLSHLKERGYSEEDILEAGLSLERSGGGHGDRFRGRLMFPIRDDRGRVIGFGARALSGEEPKYLNSPDTLVFRKGRGLYGIDLAREAIREADQAIITEGYTDVIMAHQKGFQNVVASMGTSLTEDQVRSLKRLTGRLVLALDADQAGVSATERGLEVAMDALRGKPAPIPLARNLIRFESRLEAEIEIAVLPAGKDPDDLLREDPDGWSQLIEGALPILDYHLAQAASKWDLETAKGKAAAARSLLPLIDGLGPGIARGHYLQRLARLLKVEERRLEEELAGLARATPRAEPPDTRTRGALSGIPGYTFGPERRLLSLLLEAPARLEVVNGGLAGMEVAPLDVSDFDEVENREIFGALVKSGAEAAWSEVLESLPDALHDAYLSLMELRSRTDGLSQREEVSEAIHCALRLRDRRLTQEIEELMFLLSEDSDERHRLTEAVMGRGLERTRIKKAWSRGFRVDGEEASWTEVPEISPARSGGGS